MLKSPLPEPSGPKGGILKTHLNLELKLIEKFNSMMLSSNSEIKSFLQSIRLRL